MFIVAVDDNVWSWGSSRYYQLGHGTNTTEPFPRQITSLTNIVQIACGWKHVLALNNDGQVFVWGTNKNGKFLYHCIDCALLLIFNIMFICCYLFYVYI